MPVNQGKGTYKGLQNETPEQREKRLARGRRWREKNREELRQREAERRAREPEKIRTSQARTREKYRDRYRATQKGYYDRMNAIICEAKDHPCVDCGIRLPPEVMDLDHVRGDKRFNICRWHQARLKEGETKEQILREEIAKCEVRCANCHRMRHFTESSGNYALWVEKMGISDD